MSAEDAPAIAAALRFGMDELERRVEFLNSHNGLLQRLIATFESIREEREPSPYVERQLYDGFFSRADQHLLDVFHDVPWEDRIAIIDKLEDARLKIIGRQLIHFERPDLLSEADRSDHDRALAQHLLGAEADVPWLTLPKALKEIDELLASVSAEEVELLLGHRQHLVEWSERVTSTLTKL
jgi:exodeoxyribonuclease-1